MFLLDADRWGLLAGTFFAVVVMGICFFVQGVGGFEVAFRAAVTFCLAYVAVHVLVRAVLQPVFGERIVKPRRRRPPSPGEDGTHGQPPPASPGEGG